MSDDLETKYEEINIKCYCGNGPGCGWAVITLIVCITIYNLAELYFSHKH